MPPSAELSTGVVTTSVSDAELVVRLSGDIDLGLRSELKALGRRVARHEGRVIVDLADVQFCDGTVAGFLAEVLSRGSATVRTPNRLAREFLVLYGLDRGVQGSG